MHSTRWRRSSEIGSLEPEKEQFNGSIENRMHHVRDISYHEDRSRVRTGHLPRNLAISIVRIQGRFEFLPQAHRHYARRPQDAVRQLLEPPKR